MPSLIDIRRRIRAVKNDAADHQGDEDGRGVAPAPGARSHRRGPAVLARGCCAVLLQPGRARRSVGAPAARGPRRHPAGRPHPARGRHGRQGAGRRLQRQRDQGGRPPSSAQRKGQRVSLGAGRPQGPRLLPAARLHDAARDGEHLHASRLRRRRGDRQAVDRGLRRRQRSTRSTSSTTSSSR